MMGPCQVYFYCRGRVNVSAISSIHRHNTDIVYISSHAISLVTSNAIDYTGYILAIIFIIIMIHIGEVYLVLKSLYHGRWRRII